MPKVLKVERGETMANVKYRKYLAMRADREFRRSRREENAKARRKWVLEREGWTDEQRAQAERFLVGHNPSKPACPEVCRVLAEHYKSKRRVKNFQLDERIHKLTGEWVRSGRPGR